MSSPLEQFSILPLIPMNIGNLYFSFTNSSFFMLLTLSFFLLLVHFVTKKGGQVGSRTRWSKERGGPDSGTEPYDARVSRTVPLRRV